MSTRRWATTSTRSTTTAPSGTRVPNENYAREIMQLFSIGLVELNADGTPILDANGNADPDVRPGRDRGVRARLHRLDVRERGEPAGRRDRQAARVTTARRWCRIRRTATRGHDPGAKTLLNGTRAARRARRPAGPRRRAVLNVFMHPNTGAVRRQAADPAPGHGQSVAGLRRSASRAVFANNGAGVRGDLKAVVRAILLDPEARGGVEDRTRLRQR